MGVNKERVDFYATPKIRQPIALLSGNSLRISHGITGQLIIRDVQLSDNESTTRTVHL